MRKKITLKLVLTVTFVKHGVSDEELKANMRAIAGHAADRGLMTSETEAEVETWAAEVIEQKNG